MVSGGSEQTIHSWQTWAIALDTEGQMVGSQISFYTNKIGFFNGHEIQNSNKLLEIESEQTSCKRTNAFLVRAT